MESLRTGALCHPLKFGARVAPQWRDKIILSLADSLGYRVHFLGGYDGVEGEGDGDGRLLGGGGKGRGGKKDQQRLHQGGQEEEGDGEGQQQQQRRRGGVNATEGEGDVSSSVGPPPRRRQLGVDGEAEAVVGADGSLVEEGDGEGEGPHTSQKGQGDGGEQPVLYWMPFYRITAARHELHPYNPWRKRYDCTHYCYTPLLWDPLVDALYAALADRGLK